MIRPFVRNLPSSRDYYNRNIFTIENFSGGLNNVDTEAQLSNNQLLDCKNMKFSDNFSIEKRTGIDYVNHAVSGDDCFGENLTWYDDFTLKDGSSKVITASDSKVFVDDTFLCNVNGNIEGCSFNGEYFFVDGYYLHRVVNDGVNYTVYRIINDPKFYINSFVKQYVKTIEGVDTTIPLYEVFTNLPVSVTTYDTSSGAYSADTNYYADPYGKILLTHGTGAGEVNADNYSSYYMATTETVNKDGVYIYGFKYNTMPENVFENSLFTFNNLALGWYTEYEVEDYYDEITSKVKYTFSSSKEQYKYIINSIDSDNEFVKFYPTKIQDGEIVADTTNTERIRIYSEDIQDIWASYNDITDATEKENYLNKALTEFLGNTLCRCYEPRDITWNNGEVIIDSDNNMWYQPCKNELEYSFLGENYVPNNPRAITTFNGRLWTTGDYYQSGEIRGSNVNQSAYFPAAVSLGLDPNGDTVQDMFEFDGALIIGRNRDIYAVYGNSTSGSSDNLFRLQKLDSTTGLMGRNCGALINNYYLFLGYDGALYKMNTPTTNIEYLMIRPITDFIDLKKPPLNISRDNMTLISCVAYDNDVYWRIHDKILVYSYSHQAFTYFTDLDCSCLYTDGIELYMSGATGNRYIMTHNVYNDLGVAIDAICKTKSFNLNNPSHYKFYEQLMLTLDRPEGVGSSVDVSVMFDNYRNVNAGRPQHIAIQTALFGTAKWNQSVFSSAPFVTTNWVQLNARSRSITLIFENNTLDETFKIIDVNIVYTWRDLR